ncbi:UNVERIFIED_CONTAM: hypothetical protein Cloal_0487 [Acetivibrio alkalicellulosi]
MKVKKTSIDLIKEFRGLWTINPRTRVHNNNFKKSKKKIRQESKKLCQNI